MDSLSDHPIDARIEVDARFALGASVALGVGIAVAESSAALLYVFPVALALRMTRMSVQRTLVEIRLLGWIAAFVIASRSITWTADGPRYALDGTFSGLIVALRLFMAACVAIALTRAVERSELIDALAWLIGPTARRRNGLLAWFPLSAALGLSFLPILKRDTAAIRDAYALRAGPNKRPVKRISDVSKALLRTELKRSFEIADALALRGYTPDRSLSFRRPTKGLSILLVALVCVSAATIVHFLVS